MTIKLVVNIDVDDLDRAIEFYRSAFGLRLGWQKEGIAEMLGASSTIYLLGKPAGSLASPTTSQRRNYQRHWTPVHVDFVVNDINVSVQKARTAGALLEGDIETHEWGHIAKMADPFGNGFCLIEFIGRGYGEIPS
jgi:predicted enzyme related to lactoylglutathione lyase